MVQQAASGINKRSEPRKAANARGRVVLADGSFLDCTVVDSSLSGARIRLSRRSTLPARFLLLNVRDRTVHEATVEWQHGEHAGLHFETSHVLGSELPPELDFIRKHWLECATR